MGWLLVLPDRCEVLAEAPAEFTSGRAALAPAGFLWFDVQQDDVARAPDAFRDQIEQVAGVRIHDLHLQDALNAQHPSFFDGTRDYDMLVFRKLSPGAAPPLEVAVASVAAAAGTAAAAQGDRTRRHRLQEIVTRPVTFFVFERLLVTVRSANSKTIDQIRARLLETRPRAPDSNNAPDKQRLPARPEELMLRLLNGMVDRYLELRQPLTDRLDLWQHALLDPRQPFSNWAALLAARIELRKLENLCEEQHDALQELRDSYLESDSGALASEAILVRLADVIEHVQRVLNHVRRLEASAESAVQLHFSATAHRTNQVVRTLTVITAVFAPLTLITGIFGMNFETMPLLRHPDGFWLTMFAMAGIAAVLLLFFWVKRYLVDLPGTRRRWPFAQNR